MTEAVMMALARKGMDRQEAHELTRRLSQVAKAEARPFREVLLEDEAVTSLLGEKGVEKALDPRNYLGATEAIVERVAALTKETA